MKIVTDQDGGTEMSGVSGSYSSRSQSSSDNKVKVVSKSRSSESLEEIVVVKDLTKHESGSVLKDKEPDISELSHADDVVIDIGSLDRLEETEDLVVDVQKPVGQQQGRQPLSPREINLLTRTPAHEAQHRWGRGWQIVAAGATVASAGGSAGLFYLTYVYTHVPGWEWAPFLTGTAGVINAAISGCLVWAGLRQSGIVPRTESNLR